MFFFFNKQLTKKNFDKVFSLIFEKYNTTQTINILDSLKLAGAIFSTKAGLSLSLSDLRILSKKKKITTLLNEIKTLKKEELYKINTKTNDVEINEIWNNTNEVLKSYILFYLKTNDPYNQILTVLQSGARGSKEQIHQLIGLRSLMVDQTGSLVPFPIKKSFNDGLSIFEYLLSSFGARKGIIDTALKTADSGYLTRRLIEASYEVKIISENCKTKRKFGYIKKKNNRLLIKIKRSVTNCLYLNNVCQLCFNLDLSTRKIISLGETIGILCAQSISEPSTQMTMRTFHTGGVFSKKQRKKFYTKISGFLNIYKKSQIKVINWLNTIEILPSMILSNNQHFLNAQHEILKEQKKKKETLPFFIGYLNNFNFLIKIKKINNKTISFLYEEMIKIQNKKFNILFLSYNNPSILLYLNLFYLFIFIQNNNNKYFNFIINKKIINLCTLK